MAYPRRTKHFIDASVQGSLTRRIIFHWLAFLLVAFVVSFILQAMADPFRPLSAHLKEVWWTHGPFLLVAAFMLPAYILDTIKLSHRFAGPIYSLRRAMREVAAGEQPRRLKFRQRDFWKDLAGDYNTMLERLGALDKEQESSPIDKELVAVSTAE
jgi:nitrogen fixation/metabolism regulation signal transduction histidine kinase